MKKQPAFTLIEMIITLLISSIIVAVVYYFLGISQKVIQQRKITLNKSENLAIFDGILQEDFFHCKHSELAGNKLHLIQNDLSEINYFFFPDSIIKQQNELKFSFNIKLMGYRLKNVNLADDEVIQSLEMTYLFPNDTIQASYFTASLEK